MSNYLSKNPEQEKVKDFCEAKLLFMEHKSFVNLSEGNDQLDLRSLPSAPSANEIAENLIRERKRLQSYSLDEIIAFLAVASRKWMEADSGLEHLQQHGLNFLVNWLSAENLKKLSNQSLNNQSVILDDFVVDQSTGTRMIKAIPRGVVGHWLAGNVPLLGMLGYAQALFDKKCQYNKSPEQQLRNHADAS